jgi:hypothetical protein
LEEAVIMLLQCMAMMALRTPNNDQNMEGKTDQITL